MRTILFRGKRTVNGKWVKGSLTLLSCGAARIIDDGISYDVDPFKVSQYTGQYDRKGKRVFEGDLLKITSTVFGGIIEQQVQKREDIALVEYDTKTGGYRLKVYHNGKYKRISKFSDNHLFAYEAEVIGNKWDNQELLTRGVSNEGN